jgi:serine/threonine protein phosphatase PrpC
MQIIHASERGAPSKNEDRIFVPNEQNFVLVCDGLSVKSGGEQVAEILGTTLLGEIQKNGIGLKESLNQSSKEIREALEKIFDISLQAASKKIFEHFSKSKELAGICTGCDGILQVGNYALAAHVGVGRVYLIRKGEAHLLTEDHTQLAYLRRIGKLASVSPQDQQTYSRRVTRAGGFQEEVKVDYLLVELEAGDRLCALTDGVWQVFGDGTTASILTEQKPIEEILSALHAGLSETGAEDNYSTASWEPKWEPLKEASSGADQKLKMLGKIPVFQYLSYQELVKVISFGELSKFPAGTFVCQEGDKGGEMMLILSGSTSVKKNGKELGRLEKGDVFGEMSMIDAAPRSATIVAVQATNVFAFPRADLFALFRENSQLAVKFLWGVSLKMNKRLREASNKLVGKIDPEAPSTLKDDSLPFLRSY